jgi:hypothetical protein
MEIKQFAKFENLFWFGSVRLGWTWKLANVHAREHFYRLPCGRQGNTEDCLDRHIRAMLYRVMRDNDWSFNVRVEVGVRNRLKVKDCQKTAFLFPHAGEHAIRSSSSLLV